MPSLTLTDPDMILPYGGSERESSTPSPPSQLVYLSNLNARYNSNDPHATSGGAGGRSKKTFSRSAWNHDDVTSRRLSDIGEEQSPARMDEFDGKRVGQEQGLATSPSLRNQLAAPDAKENTAWSSSSSTVSAGSTRASKEPISQQNSRDASPNNTEGANKDDGANANKAGLPEKSIIASAATGKGPGEELSSAILSSEAERILENAKKRLTVRGDRHI